MQSKVFSFPSCPPSSVAGRGRWTVAAALGALAITFAFLVAAAPCRAQATEDPALYEVTDVAVDITADSAAHARDQAIAEAQRTALEELLGRLGADASLAAKLDDDSLAALVKSFEVQNERSSSVRYIGVFTVQFRPAATRDWLIKSGASFTEIRSKPVVLLPVLISAGHPVLWEERTKWRTAWDNSHNTGLVPIIVPNGGLDDIAVMSAEEAVKGDAGALKAIASKYQTDGTVVATLDGDLDNPGKAFKITVTPYDVDGAPGDAVYLNLQPAADKAAIDNAITQAVAQVRNVLESNWRQTVTETSQTPASHLPVVVPIDTLDEWTLIKGKLEHVHAIDRTNVVTLARGATSIELEFHGDIGHLQDDLSRQNLALTQDANGIWILQLATPESPL